MTTTIHLHGSRKACRINTALTDISTHDEKIISTLYLLDVPYNPQGGCDGCKAGADGFGSSTETAQQRYSHPKFQWADPNRKCLLLGYRETSYCLETQSPSVTLKTLQLHPHRTPTYACDRDRKRASGQLPNQFTRSRTCLKRKFRRTCAAHDRSCFPLTIGVRRGAEGPLAFAASIAPPTSTLPTLP